MSLILESTLIGVGASLYAGKKAEAATRKGSKRMVAAIREGISFGKEMYKQGRADLAPFRAASAKALKRLEGMAGEESPLLQMRLEEAERTTERGLAKRGKTFSSYALRALEEGTGRITAEEAEARWGRNKYLTGLGYSATGATAEMGMRTAGMVGGALGDLGRGEMEAGMTRGGIQAGSFAGINQAIQRGLGNLAFEQYLGGLGETDFDPSQYSAPIGPTPVGPTPAPLTMSI